MRNYFKVLANRYEERLFFDGSDEFDVEVRLNTARRVARERNGIVSMWAPIPRGTQLAPRTARFIAEVTLIGEPSVAWCVAEGLRMLCDPDTVWVEAEPRRKAA